jgi:hypothetical protein
VPRPIEYYQKPAGPGSFDQGFTGTPDNTNKHANWDDLANDGDTSYNYTSGGGSALTSHLETLATVGIGASDQLLLPTYACQWGAIHRYASGTKFAGRARIRLGTTNVDSNPLTAPLSTYSFIGWGSIARPGGGDWAPADLDSLEAGVTVQTGDSHDEQWNITKIGCQWAAYNPTTGLNPLTTTPTLPGGGQRRRVAIIG